MRVAVTHLRLAFTALALSAVTATAPALAAEARSCPALRWVTLGTAGGPVPTPDRSEPANLLIAGDQTILVDTGDGTVDQLAKYGLMLGAVHSVFISHHHHDHTGGLAAVIGLRWMNQFPGVLTVYGPPGTQQIVDGILMSLAPQAQIGFGLGTPPPPPAQSVKVMELRDGATVEIDGLRVTAAANSHFDHDGPHGADDAISLSYRFALGPRSITYTGDTGPSAAVTRLAQGTSMLVSEVIDLERLVASMRQLRKDASPEMLEDTRRHLSRHHLTATEVGAMAARADAGRVVLTHFAIPPLPLAVSEADLRTGVRQSYGRGLDLARDLSSFDIGCNP